MPRSLRAVSVAVLFAAASALGCSDRAATGLEGPPVQMFNPQRDAAGQIFTFSDLAFNLDLVGWTQPAGNLDDGSAVGIIIVDSRPVGTTIQVEMIWEVDLASGPIIICLSGIINTANGLLTLNDDCSDTLDSTWFGHVLGRAEFTEILIKISGELMVERRPDPRGAL